MYEKDPQKKPKFSMQYVIAMVSSLLCFGATLWFIYDADYEFAIVAAAIHCILFITCLFIVRFHGVNSYSDSDASAANIPDNLTDILEKNEAEISKLRRDNNDLQYQFEEQSNEVDRLGKENERLTQLLAELELKQVDTEITEDLGGILPAEENCVDLDLIALTGKIITEMQPFCSKEGIRLEMSSAASSLIYHADSRYMRLLVRNIIDNSMKYMQQCGSLVITISNTGSNIFIAFKDNGKGLSLEELPNIFDLNYQGSNRVSGNGLGLAQVKAIVDHYHGSIYAHSENGMGIYIQLPL